MTAHDVTPRRARLLTLVAVALVTYLVLGVSGAVLFAHARSDVIRRVDAIVVLGGEHDGREAYGLALARSGLASAVLLSDPYPPDDPLMRLACQSTSTAVTVICRRPQPATTRGEAIMARQLADERGWTSIAVVSWRYHLPRAQYIFSHCFSDKSGDVLVHAVDRRYDFSVVHWLYVFLYQYAGFAKAVVQGSCG